MPANALNLGSSDAAVLALNAVTEVCLPKGHESLQNAVLIVRLCCAKHVDSKLV